MTTASGRRFAVGAGGQAGSLYRGEGASCELVTKSIYRLGLLKGSLLLLFVWIMIYDRTAPHTLSRWGRYSIGPLIHASPTCMVDLSLKGSIVWVQTVTVVL